MGRLLGPVSALLSSIPSLSSRLYDLHTFDAARAFVLLLCSGFDSYDILQRKRAISEQLWEKEIEMTFAF